MTQAGTKKRPTGTVWIVLGVLCFVGVLRGLLTIPATMADEYAGAAGVSGAVAGILILTLAGVAFLLAGLKKRKQYNAD